MARHSSGVFDTRTQYLILGGITVVSCLAAASITVPIALAFNHASQLPATSHLPATFASEGAPTAIAGLDTRCDPMGREWTCALAGITRKTTDSGVVTYVYLTDAAVGKQVDAAEDVTSAITRLPDDPTEWVVIRDADTDGKNLIQRRVIR